MGRITATFRGADGQPLANLRVYFRRLSLAAANSDGDFLPVGAAVVVTTDDAGEVHDDPESTTPGVSLGGGRWLVTWAEGTVPSRLLIEVPDDAGTRAMRDLVVGSEGRYGTIYWGRSEQETLSGDEVAALEQSVGRASVAGTYDFGPGSGYLFRAWPDAMTPPIPGTGIWDTASALPASLAGADEGYQESQNGWPFALTVVGGRSYRVYRSRRTLGGRVSIQVT